MITKSKKRKNDLQILRGQKFVLVHDLCNKIWSNKICLSFFSAASCNKKEVSSRRETSTGHQKASKSKISHQTCQPKGSKIPPKENLCHSPSQYMSEPGLKNCSFEPYLAAHSRKGTASKKDNKKKSDTKKSKFSQHTCQLNESKIPPCRSPSPKNGCMSESEWGNCSIEPYLAAHFRKSTSPVSFGADSQKANKKVDSRKFDINYDTCQPNESQIPPKENVCRSPSPKNGCMSESEWGNCSIEPYLAAHSRKSTSPVSFETDSSQPHKKGNASKDSSSKSKPNPSTCQTYESEFSCTRNLCCSPSPKDEYLSESDLENCSLEPYVATDSRKTTSLVSFKTNSQVPNKKSDSRKSKIDHHKENTCYYPSPKDGLISESEWGNCSLEPYLAAHSRKTSTVSFETDSQEAHKKDDSSKGSGSRSKSKPSHTICQPYEIKVPSKENLCHSPSPKDSQISKLEEDNCCPDPYLAASSRKANSAVTFVSDAHQLQKTGQAFKDSGIPSDVQSQRIPHTERQCHFGDEISKEALNHKVPSSKFSHHTCQLYGSKVSSAENFSNSSSPKESYISESEIENCHLEPYLAAHSRKTSAVSFVTDSPQALKKGRASKDSGYKSKPSHSTRKPQENEVPSTKHFSHSPSPKVGHMSESDKYSCSIEPYLAAHSKRTSTVSFETNSPQAHKKGFASKDSAFKHTFNHYTCQPYKSEFAPTENFCHSPSLKDGYISESESENCAPEPYLAAHTRKTTSTVSFETDSSQPHKKGNASKGGKSKSKSSHSTRQSFESGVLSAENSRHSPSPKDEYLSESDLGSLEPYLATHSRKTASTANFDTDSQKPCKKGNSSKCEFSNHTCRPNESKVPPKENPCTCHSPSSKNGCISESELENCAPEPHLIAHTKKTISAVSFETDSSQPHKKGNASKGSKSKSKSSHSTRQSFESGVLSAENSRHSPSPKDEYLTESDLGSLEPYLATHSRKTASTASFDTDSQKPCKKGNSSKCEFSNHTCRPNECKVPPKENTCTCHSPSSKNGCISESEMGNCSVEPYLAAHSRKRTSTVSFETDLTYPSVSQPSHGSSKEYQILNNIDQSSESSYPVKKFKSSNISQSTTSTYGSQFQKRGDTFVVQESCHSTQSQKSDSKGSYVQKSSKEFCTCLDTKEEEKSQYLGGCSIQHNQESICTPQPTLADDFPQVPKSKQKILKQNAQSSVASDPKKNTNNRQSRVTSDEGHLKSNATSLPQENNIASLGRKKQKNSIKSPNASRKSQDAESKKVAQTYESAQDLQPPSQDSYRNCINRTNQPSESPTHSRKSLSVGSNDAYTISNSSPPRQLSKRSAPLSNKGCRDALLSKVKHTTQPSDHNQTKLVTEDSQAIQLSEGCQCTGIIKGCHTVQTSTSKSRHISWAARDSYCNQPCKSNMKDSHSDSENSHIDQLSSSQDCKTQRPINSKNTVIASPDDGKKSVLKQPGSGKKSDIKQPSSSKNSDIAQPGSGKKSDIKQPSSRRKSVIAQPASGKMSDIKQPSSSRKIVIAQPVGGKKSDIKQPSISKKSVIAQPMVGKKSDIKQPSSSKNSVIAQNRDVKKSDTKQPNSSPVRHIKQTKDHKGSPCTQPSGRKGNIITKQSVSKRSAATKDSSKKSDATKACQDRVDFEIKNASLSRCSLKPWLSEHTLQYGLSCDFPSPSDICNFPLSCGMPQSCYEDIYRFHEPAASDPEDLCEPDKSEKICEPTEPDICNSPPPCGIQPCCEDFYRYHAPVISVKSPGPEDPCKSDKSVKICESIDLEELCESDEHQAQPKSPVICCPLEPSHPRPSPATSGSPYLPHCPDRAQPLPKHMSFLKPLDPAKCLKCYSSLSESEMDESCPSKSSSKPSRRGKGKKAPSKSSSNSDCSNRDVKNLRSFARRSWIWQNI